jgi:putative transposase
LTLSCHRRLKLFTADAVRKSFLTALDGARKEFDYEVWAYVIMPEHVHVLANPRQRAYDIQAFRTKLKKDSGLLGMSFIRADPVTLANLAVKEGSLLRHRFWQDGKGYDRNLWTPHLIWKSIRYIHGNPVQRGLCETPAEWPWSSYRWFEGIRPVEFECDPCPVEPPDPENGIWRVWLGPE